MLTECQNCSSIWSLGTEEFEFQQCDACGWQPGQPIDEETNDDEFEDDDETWEEAHL